MTKKHFIAMAEEFNHRVKVAKELDIQNKNTIASDISERMIQAFCNVAYSFNPRFDRFRFLKACGI